MAVRKIVQIDEEKCDGCGLCVPSCEEGAIQIIEGKARLVSDIYCDGLGACLGECPQGAITLEEREAEDFDADKAHEFVQRMKEREQSSATRTQGCPGSALMNMMRQASPNSDVNATGDTPSALGNWPVQLHLVPPMAPYFADAEILLAADCVPFACADFHRRVLAGKVLLIGCPKLDDSSHYVEKLAAILESSSVKGLTIAHMEVPCCMGLMMIARAAVEASGKDVPIREMVVSIRGEVTRDTNSG